jgi:hypothetical protein
LPYDANQKNNANLWREYFLYFLNSEDSIQARHGFIAIDDADAAEFAAFLACACRDVCTKCELWSGARLVARVSATAAPMRFDLFSDARQEQIIDLAEMLLKSGSHIATSRQLVESIEAARKHNG